LFFVRRRDQNGGRASTEWVTTRLTVGFGLAGYDPRRLVGGSPAVTHGVSPATAQKPVGLRPLLKNQEKEKKNEEDDGSDPVFLSYFLKIQ
jgi:hypothetical protein